MTEKKQTSRWINMLLIVLIPIGGYGCGAAAPMAQALIKVAVWVGGILVCQ